MDKSHLCHKENPISEGLMIKQLFADCSQDFVIVFTLNTSDNKICALQFSAYYWDDKHDKIVITKH